MIPLAAFSCSDDDAGSADNGHQNTDAGNDSSTSECTENATRCIDDGKSVETCHSNEWKKTSDCEATETCTDGACGPTSGGCTEDAKRCSSDNKKVETCHSNVWSTPSTCGDEKECVSGSCQDLPRLNDPCDEATFVERCVGDISVSCWDDKVDLWDCAEEGGICTIIGDGKSWCVFPDEDDVCTEPGLTMIDSVACDQYDAFGVTIFEWCVEKGADWYNVSYDWAESVCLNGSIVACTSDDSYSTTPCPSGQCIQKWDKAVCVAP